MDHISFWSTQFMLIYWVSLTPSEYHKVIKYDLYRHFQRSHSYWRCDIVSTKRAELWPSDMKEVPGAKFVYNFKV
jgi:hypothetical protein